jgi:hypothetical protein
MIEKSARYSQPHALLRTDNCFPVFRFTLFDPSYMCMGTWCLQRTGAKRSETMGPHTPRLWVHTSCVSHIAAANLCLAGLLSEISAITNIALDSTSVFVLNAHGLPHYSWLKRHRRARPAPAPHAASELDAHGAVDLDTHAGIAETPAHLPVTSVQAAVEAGRGAQGVKVSARRPHGSEEGWLKDASHSSGGGTRGFCLLQHGVLRTNCIDCLDRCATQAFAQGSSAVGQKRQGHMITGSQSRPLPEREQCKCDTSKRLTRDAACCRTNVAQFAYGLFGFGRQLYLLGLSDSPQIDSGARMGSNNIRSKVFRAMAPYQQPIPLLHAVVSQNFTTCFITEPAP